MRAVRVEVIGLEHAYGPTRDAYGPVNFVAKKNENEKKKGDMIKCLLT